VAIRKFGLQIAQKIDIVKLPSDTFIPPYQLIAVR
jgi:hypothetical protein